MFLEDGPYPNVLKDEIGLRELCLVDLKHVTNKLPMQIGDYTDFFAGLHHARNCGVIFREPSNALQPNYRHLPVAYHGRASSVVVSGTQVRRPRGQILLNPSAQTKTPVLAPSRRLDFELELGCFLCKSSDLGEPIPVHKTSEYLFGVVLLNDWSARDFQTWESMPLGPFTSKNFCSSISPWVVLMDALEPFQSPGLDNEGVQTLEYLRETESRSIYDMELTAAIIPAGQRRESVVTRTNGRNLLWSFSQMLAHHTVGGCNANVGDLLGSGTISGAQRGQFGSLLENSEGGKEKITLDSDVERLFLEDGDTILFRGVCGDELGSRVGFGECIGTILAAKS